METLVNNRITHNNVTSFYIEIKRQKHLVILSALIVSIVDNSFLLNS